MYAKTKDPAHLSGMLDAVSLDASRFDWHKGDARARCFYLLAVVGIRALLSIAAAITDASDSQTRYWPTDGGTNV